MDPLTTAVGDSSAVVAELRTAPGQPPTRGVLDVELTLRDRSGAPLDGVTVDVVPWMTSHGHGTSTSPTVLAEGSGRYWVSDVDVYMPGRWELRVTLSGAVNDQFSVVLDVQ
jgi:hypothetical protein